MEETQGNLPPWLLPTLAGVFSSIGGGLLLGLARIRVRHAAAQTWPCTSGRITACSVSRHEDASDGATHVWHRCDLRYEYAVDGRLHEGKRLAIGGGSGDEAGAQEEHRRYPEGATVIVYYNPKAPKDAVLERDTAPKSARVLLIVGSVFFFASLLLLAIQVIVSQAGGR